MTVNDLMRMLSELDDDLIIVIEEEKGIKEASHISLFLNVLGTVVVKIE